MNISGNLSKTAQATLLLTSYFSRATHEDTKPLTNAEWGRFALWLKESATTPADLLGPDPGAMLNDWNDARISADRIVRLLNRGHSLALALEKWQRAGLWVVTRSDPEYPRRLKLQLKTDSPPVLFGCGNRALLNTGGLAVVGSRNAGKDDLLFTDQVGAEAAAAGISIVSGGARGVDEAAMLGAMKKGGVVVGVMADSLLKAATSAKWRKGLMDGHVVLISPFYPEAGFNAGNAMARNKYIYCLADSSLVIHSGKTGGTLSGAQENLKKNWVPLWVKTTADEDAANADLVAQGGRWCASDVENLKISDLFNSEEVSPSQSMNEHGDSSLLPKQPELFSEVEPEASSPLVETEDTFIHPVGQVYKVAPAAQVAKFEESISNPVDFYRLFIIELVRLAGRPTTIDQLSEITGLHKSQLTDWLTRAVDEGVVKKLNRPVRYQVTGVE